jgi:ferric-dicitrate binding protein FerR (iron transport regulator)
VALERGKLRVNVAKRKGADWRIRALGYVVSVTGTEFDVALDAGALRGRGRRAGHDQQRERSEQPNDRP